MNIDGLQVGHIRNDCTINIPAEDLVRKVEADGVANGITGRTQYVEWLTVKYYETSAIGSVFSKGSLRILCALGAAAVLAVGVLMIAKKKKRAAA